MKLVMVVAQYRNMGQLAGFLDSLAGCSVESLDSARLLVVNTDGSHARLTVPNMETGTVTISDRPRKYASVMYEKIRIASPWCDGDTIFCNVDPDYSLNSYALEVAHEVMRDNPQINYLSLLKEPGMADLTIPRIELSGWRFCMQPSAMGGAMICRWSHFGPNVQEFFREYGVTGDMPGRAGGFDQEYWRFLTRRAGGNSRHVAMSDIGWVQHCNTVSNYLESKGAEGVLSHMYSLDFDPRMNPFEIRKLTGWKE
ncbi:MAG: hypothetical protein WC654_00785 [Patescibacteria group bacterium]